MNTIEDICRSYADSLAGCTEAEATALTLEFEYVALLLRHEWKHGDTEHYLRGARERVRMAKLQPIVDPSFVLWNAHCPPEEQIHRTLA